MIIDINPLVSVGIPCYNRPEGLRRTLECITRQTYDKLEIIISDNCSPNQEIEKIGNEYAQNDDRIIFIKQNKNHGALQNFRYLLEKARGDYFMWAADDDLWDEYFIETLLLEFKKNNNLVAVMTECQYVKNTDLKKTEFFDFFPEGQFFYNFHSDNPYLRIKHLLKYNYGNLFYSLYKTQALHEHNRTFFDLIDNKSMNEIPLFIYVMQKGNWKVIPKICFYKRTNENVYIQAKWEKEGGRLPRTHRITSISKFLKIYFYHFHALNEIFLVINQLNLSWYEKGKLKFYSFFQIGFSHFIFILIGKKIW